MELILWALLLTVLQGLCFVPRDGVAFVGLPGGLRALRGPGTRLWNPWPGARAWLAGALPFRLAGADLICDAPLRRVGADPFRAERRVSLDAIGDLAVRGPVVRIDGRPFARCVSKEQAREAVALIETLRQAPASKRAAVLGDWLDHSFSLGAWRSEAATVTARTRWLVRSCAAQAVVMFGLAPLLVLRFGETLGLLLAAPVVAGLHLVAVGLLVVAHRRLFPGAGGDRFELTFTAALYPPLLFRTPEILSRACAARFHPAVVAAAALPVDRRTAFLRRAYARARHAGDAVRAGDAQDGSETADRLRALARAAEVPTSALEGPPAGPEPGATSYCPVCDAGHRAGFARCRTCDVPTLPVGA